MTTTISLFKQTNPLENRKEESSRIRTKYSNKVPLICEKMHSSKIKLQTGYKEKYLCPCDFTLAQFMHVLRQKIEFSPEKALFLFINGQIKSNTRTLGDLYEEDCDKDGFLYVFFDEENVFG
jgi:GABA(A) receptor-associated protein